MVKLNYLERVITLKDRLYMHLVIIIVATI